MKKVLYVIAVAAATIFAAGCAREQAASVAAGQDAANVTFTVSAPGIATKAISDGTSATQLTFAVYDDAGNYLKELSENAATVTGANPTWTVTVPVVQQLTYQFVFIAKATTSPYTVDLANKKVTATYGAANDDAADFFYAALKETVGSDLNKSVELVRPLAQVNVGAADLVAAAYSLNVENMTTGLKLTGINNVLNILDGTVSGSADITLAEATRVKEGTTQFVTGYDRIAMGYVLVGEKQTTNATINITAKGKIDGADKVVVRDVPNVPIQANYRTNILGNIFTSNMTFNVVVEPGFDTPEINETLETNIEKANTLFAAGETSVTVDLAPAEGGETTVTLPATTNNVRLNLNITTDKTITVKYADGAKPANVEIYAKDVEALVADLSSSTVTITAGSHIHTGTFKTAATTLIIEVTAKVDNLVVNAGTTKIYGEVATISGDAAADAAYYIATVEDLKAFRDAVNGGKMYVGLNVKLENDIDLSGIDNWTPIGVESYTNNFRGIFDGQNHVISNLKVNHVKTAGLFGTMNRGTIKNLVVDGLTITSNHYAGGIVAWVERGGSAVYIENCVVKNGSVTSTPELVGTSYDNGDKVGGIIGFAYKLDGITNNTVENVTLTAYRDLAGIAGYATAANLTGNTVKDVNIIQSLTNAYKSDIPTTIGAIVGRTGDPNTLENNTEVNVTIITIVAEGITVDSEGRYVISSKVGFENFRNLANAGNNFSGKTVLLDTDIDLANEAWTPIYLNGDATKFAGVFDGNGKTISNLKVDLTATPAYQAAGLFGASAGTIKNLTIDGASVKNLTTGSATVNGSAVVVGSMPNDGTIENITVKNATVEANRYCGGIVGYVSGTVKDCVVEQLSIICTPDNLGGSYDNGDKSGGIYGYLNSPATGHTNLITGNKVDNFEVRGYRDLGGIGGTALVAGTISGNTATNGTIIIDQKTNSYGTKDANAHEIVGRSNATPTISDNTFENVEVVEFIADGVYSKDGIIHVSKPASLATAVSEAPDGATIALADGIYNSGANLEIKKNLTIKAENDKQAQIDGKIIITNDKTIRLENLLLQNDNLAPATTNQWYEKTTTAIVGSYNGSIEVDNCLIKAKTKVAALYLYGANSVEDHLYVTNSVFDGSLAYANDPAEGFRPLMCQGNLKIENCTFIKLDRYVCQMYGTGGSYASTVTVIGNKVDNPTSPDNYSVANILSVGKGATLDNVVIDVHGNTDLDGNAKQFTYACKTLTLIGSNITYATGCDAIEWKLQDDLKNN